MYKIETYKRRKNLKHKFRRYCKKYKIDKKTNRQQRKFVFLDKKGNQNKKSYFIAYLKEKKLIIDNLHKLSCHRGINTLYNLIMEQEFYWYNIISDVKNYISNCLVCQEIHKTTYKKPKIKQILSSMPKERYVVDLIEIDKEMDDCNQKFKFILNIIDHFTIFTGSYLLEHKNPNEFLFAINDFIAKNGKPNILQTDNGREFHNNKLHQYC